MQIRWNILSKYKNELYGFSILWIILYHGTIKVPGALGKELALLSGFIKRGNCGVEIFLFLSGICLYYSMKKEFNIKNFYIRRFKRIIMPFLLINGIYWFIICVVYKHDIFLFLKNITLFSFWFEGNKIAWFIALIIPLYILYPFLFKYILNNNKINRLFYIVLLCVTVYVICGIIKYFEPKWFKMIEIALTRIPVFLLGSYCGILAYENKTITSSVKLVSFIIVIMGIGYFYVYPIGVTKVFRSTYLLLGPSIAIWIAICLKIISNNKLNVLLSNWGGLSLELYLSHMILRNIFIKSFLIGNSKVINYYKYLIFVLLGAYVISKLVVYVQEKIILKVSHVNK